MWKISDLAQNMPSFFFWVFWVVRKFFDQDHKSYQVNQNCFKSSWFWSSAFIQKLLRTLSENCGKWPNMIDTVPSTEYPLNQFWLTSKPWTFEAILNNLVAFEVWLINLLSFKGAPTLFSKSSAQWFHPVSPVTLGVQSACSVFTYCSQSW